MLKPSAPNLSVVVPTCRPKWLANCLSQIRSQVGPNFETVVVAEGDPRSYKSVLSMYNPTKVIYKEVEGKWGAYAKDAGLAACRGRYVVWWDDDNIYYPHALASLYAAAVGHDIGIVKTWHFGRGCEIPKVNKVEWGNIDTMCLCVRRDLAGLARWADHDGKGTDFAYLTKLLPHVTSLNFSDVRIGEKLEEFCSV